MDVPWAETILGEVSVARFREALFQTQFRAPLQQKPLSRTDLRVFADRRTPDPHDPKEHEPQDSHGSYKQEPAPFHLRRTTDR